MAGWFHNGICYAEQAQAIDAHFQAIQPSIIQTINDTQITRYVKQPTGEWQLVKQTISTSGSVTNNYALTESQPVQLQCDSPDDHTTQFLDGMQLGWGVALAMITVFVIRRSYRGF